MEWEKEDWEWVKKEWEDNNGYDLAIPEKVRIRANEIYQRESDISRRDSIRLARISLKGE